MEMRKLIDALNYYTKLYDEGNPAISDEEWDHMYFELQEMEQKTGIIYPDSPTQNITYTVVNSLEKVKHNHFMGSLAKTKDWNEFLRYFSNIDASESVTGMLKLDGLTCCLTYEYGKLISAETRGNGEIGENILHNARVIPSIPKEISYKETLVLDGEILITAKDFDNFKDEYANPRNLASGSIRLLDSEVCASRKLTFVVWNIVKGFNDTNSFIDKLNKAEELGFTVVPWVSSFDWDAKEFLLEFAQRKGYPIDGLVGRFDNISFGESLGSTSHHIKSAYAWKQYDEEYKTTLLDIEWSAGKTGALTPVAIFKEVDTGDSVISKASLHNINIMTQILGEHPSRGQTIYVVKQNMIIPQVVRSEDGDGEEIFTIPEVCPICGKKTEINSSNILMCSNPLCDGKIINKIDHFLGKKGLDVKGFSKITLEKLLDWGWISCYSDVFNLKDYYDEWIKKDGFGEKSVTRLLDAIDAAAAGTELWQFISALSIPNIGSTYGKIIAKNFNSWEDFISAVQNNYDFMSWDGFGYEINNAILSFDYSEANSLIENKIIILKNSLYAKTFEPNNLSGKNICITGKLKTVKNRDELVAKIEAAGGKFVSSVSSKTNYLVNNDFNSTSSKNTKAKQLGVPIITEEQLLALL